MNQTMNQTIPDYKDQPYCCVINEDGWHVRDCKECYQHDCVKSPRYNPLFEGDSFSVWDNRIEKACWWILIIAVLYFGSNILVSLFNGSFY